METTPTRENPCSFALIPPNVKNPHPSVLPHAHENKQVERKMLQYSLLSKGLTRFVFFALRRI